MKKTDEQLKLEDFWMRCYVAHLQSGGGAFTSDSVADFAVEEFKKRFPPVFTPIQDKQPD